MEKLKTISRRYIKPRWYYTSQDKKGTLYIENVSVKELAAKYDTPLYIMVEREIRNRLRRFKSSFPYSKLRVQYATKCNSNLEILKIAREEGFEVDVSSVGEIILTLLADFKPEQITFTNLHKSEQDILFAAKVGVNAITMDSLEELKRTIKVGEKIRRKIRIFIRINPLIKLGGYSTHHHQYGIPYTSAKNAIRTAVESRGVELVGLHFHGSYIDSPRVYTIAARKLLKLSKYAASLGVKVNYIDLGGGFPVEISNKKVFTPEEMGERFVKDFKNALKKYKLPQPVLVFEPGKFIVANAGIGLVKVISKKCNGSAKHTLVTDGSAYGMLPDTILKYSCEYDILPATKLIKPIKRLYNIAGCTCDSIDIMGRNRWLPNIYEDDLLAIMDCGAYSSVIASNFNSLKRAPIVMIKENGSTKLIRRRDRYSEMFAPELDVLKVAEPKEMKKFYDLFRVNTNKLWGNGIGPRK